MTPVAEPTLRHERRLGREGARLIIGVDEVGRGALAGPVAVGMCVIDAVRPGRFPVGLRDSKMLSEARREHLAPLAAAWAAASVVGLASAAEVDSLGIIACLGLAGQRAINELHELGVDIDGAMILLDGSHDWLSPALSSPRPVTMKVKADRDCASVAAASVVAKVHRDRLMIELDAVAPGYDWASNKGYGSSRHFEGLDLLGASDHHRRTWLKSERMLDLSVEAGVGAGGGAEAEAVAGAGALA